MADQLHLGEGDLGEQVDFEDHEVKTPMNLYLDKDVSLDAKGAFAIMKSFGKRANASLKAYSERAGCTVDTFRKLQKVLQNTAWVVLLREGKDQEPRLWWMCKVKGEQPPLSAMFNTGSGPTGGGAGATKKPAPGSLGGVAKRDPKQGSSRVSEVSDKEPAAKAAPFKAADGTLWQDLVDLYVIAFKDAKDDPKAEPEFSPADFAQLKRISKDGRFNRTLYISRLANMRYHTFARTKEFSLQHFCTNFKEFDDKAHGITVAKSGGRPGTTRYNAVLKSEDFDGGSGND